MFHHVTSSHSTHFIYFFACDFKVENASQDFNRIKLTVMKSECVSADNRFFLLCMWFESRRKSRVEIEFFFIFGRNEGWLGFGWWMENEVWGEFNDYN